MLFLLSMVFTENSAYSSNDTLKFLVDTVVPVYPTTWIRIFIVHEKQTNKQIFFNPKLKTTAIHIYDKKR